MIDPVRRSDVTIRDVVDGLAAMEAWTRQLREALSGLDPALPVPTRTRLAVVSPRVEGGVCPPGRDDTPKKPKGPKKGGKKK